MSAPGAERASRASRTAVVRALGLLWSAAPGWSAGFAALCLLAGVLVPLDAWLLANTLDTVAGGAGVAAAVAAVALLGGAAVTSAAVAALARYAEAELARRVALRAKATLMLAVARITGLELLERPAFLDRLRLAEQAGTGGPPVLIQAVFGALRATVAAAGLVAVLAAVNPWLVLLVGAGSLPAVAATLAESRERARVLWQVTPGFRREMFYGSLLTDAGAAKEIRLFGLGELLHDRMTAELRAIAGAQRRVDRRAAWVQGGLAAAGAVLGAGALVWGALRAVTGAITVGELSLLVTGLAGLRVAAAGLVRSIGDGHHSALVFGHYEAVLALAAEAAVVPAPASLPGPRPVGAAGVELRDLTFGYAPDHAPVLRGVSFTIPPGAMVALVGANGAGKSTIVKLLCRLYEPTSGQLRWDGRDIAALDPADVRRRVSVLFQDFMRYDLTVADNIGFGDVRRLGDESALRAAARLAGADTVVDRLPRGYSTMLSRVFGGADESDGVQLSGGQWQRVALARTLLRDDADLLILDEPSSGLDADAEAELYEHLRTRRGGRSCLLVTHRLSAVRHADTIVVLAAGRVVEQGTHEQLLGAGGEYARLYRRQAHGFGRAADAAAG